MLRSEVRVNRQKVIDFLKAPRRRKAYGVLDDGWGRRCCLGHACVALGIKRVKDGWGQWSYGLEGETKVAPLELLKAVGFWHDEGSARAHSSSLKIGEYAYSALAEANDDQIRNVTPFMIGEYLESVIEGGDHTPWEPLTNYPETP